MSIWICQYCEEEFDPDIEHVDHSHEGFWCDFCDGFTYYDGKCHHRFTLILEGKEGPPTPLPTVKPKFKKHISPLRYPGGKSKLTPLIYTKLQEGET